MAEAFFIGLMRCPFCGTIAQGEVPTRSCWSERDIAVGDAIDLIELRGNYLPGPERASDPRLRLLENWNASCCPPEKWAIATIIGGRLESLIAVPLNGDALRDADWISIDVDEALEAATGKPCISASEHRTDWMAPLEPALLGWQAPRAVPPIRASARAYVTAAEREVVELLRSCQPADWRALAAGAAVTSPAVTVAPVEDLPVEVRALIVDMEDSWWVGRESGSLEGHLVSGPSLRGLARQLLVERGLSMELSDQDYPCGAALARGHWTLVAPLRGTAERGCFLAMSRDGTYAVATLTSTQRDPLDVVRARLASSGKGIAELTWIGAVEELPTACVAIIELEPPGRPLAEEWLPLRADAVARLGLGLVDILADHHMIGEAVGGLRPETIYIDFAADADPWSPHVTGLVPRGEAFMAGQAPRSTGSVTPYTFLYDAPEVLRGHAPTPASDVFAACAVLAHIATTEHPFEGEGAFAQLTAITGGRRRPFRGPAAIARIVDQGLVADPRRRPTAADLAARLAAVTWP